MRPFLIFLALCLWLGLCLGGAFAKRAATPADPYACFGAGRYEAMAKGHECESMVASYYGAESGYATASGERFNPKAMTAAHRSLPFGTLLFVCYVRCVVVRVNDRGPYIAGRSLDLSEGAAGVVGMLDVGVARVTVGRL